MEGFRRPSQGMDPLDRGLLLRLTVFRGMRSRSFHAGKSCDR